MGARLGPYVIVAPVGAGGMGEVYRAHDARLDRVVAIKVLSPDAHHPDAHERLRREARSVARLSHPHICALHDIGVAGETEFLVMEYLEGETLADHLASGPLSLEEALRHAIDILGALGEAHRQGVIHRDLKPGNVMLTRAGVKVLDFGLAELRQPEGAARSTMPTRTVHLTAEGALVGTLPYMAPEQLEERPVDARTDIFAFGVTLYEMVTGRRPFRGDSRAGVIAAILASEPEPLRASIPGAPPLLDRAVRRCLAKDPDERWQTVRDLAAELSFISASSTQTRPPDRPEDRPAPGNPAPEAVRLRFLRGPTLAGAAAVVLTVAIAASLRWRAPPVAIESLAVLPFQNTTREPDAEYLGDGLTESLIEQLSRVPSLRVMARATVFRFKGSTDPQGMGRTLGVGAVLTGTVSRRGEQLSISAELVEIPSGVRLWGQKYDRPVVDLLYVQDSIASDIADGLRLSLTGEQRRSLSRHGTENVEAYQLFLKARFLLARDTEEDDLEARDLYRQAVEKDPSYVEARLGIASTYLRGVARGQAPLAEVWQGADEHLQKALALQPDNVLARCARANRRFMRDWDWTAAEREFRELSGDSRIVQGPQFHVIAMFLWARGRPGEAAALVEKALRVDPGNLEARIMMADFLAHAGRLEEAIVHYRAIAKDEPANASPLFGLADVLKGRGDVTGAIAALRGAYEASGEEHGAKALASARTEQDYEEAELAVARVRLADLEARAKQQYVSHVDLGRLYAQVGERDKAFASLQAALADRSPNLLFLKADRAWDHIRNDPRFGALVQRVGIP